MTQTEKITISFDFSDISELLEVLRSARENQYKKFDDVLTHAEFDTETEKLKKILRFIAFFKSL